MFVRRAALFLLISLTVPAAQAITTPEIAASALSPECVHYQIVGVCYWLFCSPFGCSVRTSVKVRHFRPDLVVSAYSVTGQNPWTEMSPLSSPLPGIAEAGGDTNPELSASTAKSALKMLMQLAFLPVMRWQIYSLSLATSAPHRHSLFSPTFSARWMRSPGAAACRKCSTRRR